MFKKRRTDTKNSPYDPTAPSEQVQDPTAPRGPVVDPTAPKGPVIDPTSPNPHEPRIAPEREA